MCRVDELMFETNQNRQSGPLAAISYCVEET